MEYTQDESSNHPDPSNKLNSFTASMFMNKNAYKKIMKKNEPDKYFEKQNHHSKLRKYRKKIIHLVEDYLDDPDKDFTLNVNGVLYEMGKVLVHYLEVKELDKEGGCYESNTEKNDCVLFENTTEED